jgi:hypothetical protein
MTWWSRSARASPHRQPSNPVVTSFDQRLVTGPVTMCPDRAQPLYVHHGEIGHVSLDPAEQHRLFAGTERRTGSWSDITREGSSQKLFT